MGAVKLVVRTFVFLQIAKETPKLKLSPLEVRFKRHGDSAGASYSLRPDSSSALQVGAAWWVALGYICHPQKPLPVRERR